MGRRTLLLIAALVVAALGTVLVFLYVNNVRNEVDASQQPVQVLVAKTSIAAGTTGSDAAANGAFDKQTVPAANVVPGALSDATPLANLVAISQIFPGQQIIAAQWGTTAQTAGLVLPDGTMAVSLQLGDPERVAGFITPGSTVAIFATGGPSVKLLMSNVPVIAVGPTVTRSSGSSASPGTGGNTEAIPTAILTLALSQNDTQKIIAAQGRISSAVYTGMYFALMDKKTKIDAANPGTNNANLFK